MKMNRDERLAGADFIRAAACLLVLAHHLVLRLDTSRLPIELRPAFDLARFGNYGVTLFFVLSGFLLTRPFWAALNSGATMPSLKIYALRRAARILPGFWVALTVGFLLSFTVYDFPLNGELVMRYLAGFLLMSQWHWKTFFPVQGDGPLWSIPFEATCYLFLPLCFLPLFRCRKAFAGPMGAMGGLFFWTGIIGLFLVAHWLIVTYIPTEEAGRGWDFGFQGGAKEWMPRYNPIGFFAIFAIGAYAAGILAILPSKRSLLYDLIALLALIAGAAQFPLSLGGPWEGYGWLGIPYRFPFLPLGVGTALCVLPRSVFLGALLDNPASRFVAKVSFGVYVWQDIVISLMKQFFPWTFGATGSVLFGWTVSSTVAALIIFAIATMSYIFLERPVIRWARDLESSTLLPKRRLSRQ